MPHEIDPVKAEERLLWLEGRGLALAQEARRIRRRIRGRPWIAPDDIAEEMALVQRELIAREDEVRIWVKGETYAAGTHLTAEELAAVDAYAAKHDVTRTEAIRRLVAAGLLAG